MQRLSIVCLALLWLTTPALADGILLENGARLQGEATRSPSGEAYRIVMPSGATIVVAADEVRKLDDMGDAWTLYERRVHAVPDTPEAQFALAEWCLEQKLVDEYRQHLERVIELDPNHEAARRMLEYRKVDGRWLTREEQMAERGLVYYDGRYRTRQDIALRVREESREEKQADWRGNIKRWRRWLDDRRGDRVQEAVASFKSLKEPAAAEPLVELLSEEADPRVRRLLVEAAANIDHQATVNALVTISLQDPDEELRYQAGEYLIDSGRPGLVASYAKMLDSTENAVVNRAAIMLGSLESRSAMAPLIDALVTEHKQVVGAGTPAGDTVSFAPTSGGFAFGGGGPKITKYKVRNPQVLNALVRLSGGETFGYDAERWRRWLATQTVTEDVNLRRQR